MEPKLSMFYGISVMVAEIHRQFDSIPGLKQGDPNAKPEYDKCIDVATTGALRELIPAGLVAIVATIAVGFIGGPLAVGGYQSPQ